MFEIEELPIIDYIVRAYAWMDLYSIDSETSFKRKIKRKLKFMLYICLPVFAFLGSFETDDRSESLYLIAVSICTSLHVVRFHYICTKMELISDLLKIFSTHQMESKENFQESHKTLKNFNYFSIGLIGASTLMLTLSAGFVFKKTLVFKIWFPLNWKENDFNYYIAYAFIIYCVFVSYTMVSFVVLSWYLFLNVSIKCRTLGYALQSLGWHSAHENLKTKYFLENFVKCVKGYKTLKCNIKQLSSCFQFLLLGQIITSAAGICTTVYSLSFDTTATISQSVINFYLLLYNIFDIFMIMHFGNEIKSAQANMTTCLFNSNWLEQPEQVKKLKIIFMEMLTQPQELLIGKLYPLNLDTFMSILKGAYSMFNILRNFK